MENYYLQRADGIDLADDDVAPDRLQRIGASLAHLAKKKNILCHTSQGLWPENFFTV